MSGAARLAAAAWSTIFWSQSFGWSLCHTFKRFKQALSFIIINVYQSKSTHRVCRSIIVYSNNWCHLLGGTGESICTEVGELQVEGGWTFFNSPYSCIVRPIIRDDTPLFQIIQRSTWLLRVVNDVKGATQVRSRPHGRCANQASLCSSTKKKGGLAHSYLASLGHGALREVVGWSECRLQQMRHCRVVPDHCGAGPKQK